LSCNFAHRTTTIQSFLEVNPEGFTERKLWIAVVVRCP